MSTPEIVSLDGATCLVTGGAGYLGRNLVAALLERGANVHVLDLASAPDDIDARVRWFAGDITSESDVAAALEGVDTVFHTAALIELAEHYPKKFGEKVRKVNLGGTENLLRQAAKAGVKRFVHTSSTNAVYGQDTRGTDESLPYSTAPDLYSSTKAACEKIALEANGQGGMLTAAIRPGGIYGPGERKTLVKPMIRAIKKGFPVLVFGDGRSRLDYSYIENLVDGHLRAAERLFEGSPVAGQAYFITDGQPINPGEFSTRLVRNVGLGTPVKRMSKRNATAIAWVCEKVFEKRGRPAPAFTLVSVGLCTRDNYFSIEKAKRDLDYVPLCDTDEGLRRTAAEVAENYASI